MLGFEPFVSRKCSEVSPRSEIRATDVSKRGRLGGLAYLGVHEKMVAFVNDGHPAKLVDYAIGINHDDAEAGGCRRAGTMAA